MWRELLSDVEREIQDAAARFAAERIRPYCAEWDEREEFPEDVFRDLGRTGFLGVFVPEQFGGAGAGNLCWVLVMEAIAREDAGVAAAMLAHCHAMRALLLAGSDVLREAYLPRACSGEVILAFAQTEPEAGSDAAAIRTAARRTPDGGYTLRGHKRFCSNSHVADAFVVTAKTAPELGGRGISLFLVDARTPGLALGRRERKLGARSFVTGDVLLEDCRVPGDRLLGEEGRGFSYVLRGLVQERMGNTAISLGIAEAALAEAVSYARQRVAFGRPIADNQGIRWLLADMSIQVEAARALAYQAARIVDRFWLQETTSRRLGGVVARAKVLANEMALSVVSNALQIHGGYGFTKDYRIEKLYRDVRVFPIGGGTTQIQRNIIAEELLG
ncbi:MAG: acyl-CoA dehydrogenase family protein [Clostridia bacterium]|nr:acyl-CoA dehydrogenase family protein [Clostridia bacterium]